MIKASIFALAFASLISVPMLSQAAVVQSTGSGSAVTTVDATADFESQSALSGLNYQENGLAFTRVGLSENYCGYAGCDYHSGFNGFTGNYMYGVGDGYYSMTTTGGKIFAGLEFAFGSGFGGYSATVEWQAFNKGVLVGSGALVGDYGTNGTTLGFRDLAGFDELRYTGAFSGFTAPAFDSVRAQYIGAAPPAADVPEPASMLLFGLGLAALAGMRRRSAK
jgi:hypothetical protein